MECAQSLSMLDLQVTTTGNNTLMETNIETEKQPRQYIGTFQQQSVALLLQGPEFGTFWCMVCDDECRKNVGFTVRAPK